MARKRYSIDVVKTDGSLKRRRSVNSLRTANYLYEICKDYYPNCETQLWENFENNDCKFIK